MRIMAWMHIVASVLSLTTQAGLAADGGGTEGGGIGGDGGGGIVSV